MFTGLVETIGSIVSLNACDELAVLSLRAERFAGELMLGQSVAVSGACLTVSGIDGNVFAVDMTPETLKKTKFRNIHAGTKVNLERALLATGRLDGHIVTGHVDGLGQVRKLLRNREGYILTLSMEEEISHMMVPQGSITVDGVSLTVARRAGNTCSVSLIPTTLESTTLGELRPGDEVNIETDILGKYVRQFLEGYFLTSKHTNTSILSRDVLRDAGWL